MTRKSSAIGVRHEPIAPVIDAVLDVFCARLDDLRLLLRVVGGNEQHLAERLAAGVDDDPLTAAAEVERDVEAFVGLLEHQRVVGLSGSEVVSPHAIRTHGLVGGDVEDRPVVVRPRDIRARRREFNAHAEIAEPQRVLLATVKIGDRQHLLAVADVERVDREDRVALGLAVLVEQNL
jgi:hypothetical protein